MAEKETELPNQASQRGKAGISETGRSVRDAVRAGEAVDVDDLKTAHGESGYRLPESFYKLDPALEAQKQTGNERGLKGPHARDEPDKSDPAVKAAQAAVKQGEKELEELQEKRDEQRDAALESELPGAPAQNKDAALAGKPRGSSKRK